MKHTFLITAAMILLVALSGCKTATPTASGPEPSSTSLVSSPVPSEGYPAPSVYNPTSPYPAPAQGATPTENTSWTPMPTLNPDPAQTPLIVSEVTHSADGIETYVVKNISSNPIDVIGTALYNPTTFERVFLDPAKSLAPGATVTVYNAPANAQPPEGIKWTDHRMLNHEGDEVVLINKVDRLLWVVSYNPGMK